MRVGIIGGGISSLMTTYRLLKLREDIEIVIFEKGNSIRKRKCPILEKKVDKCVKCNHCAIMEGMAGAGAFSDGKYNITHEFGGWLQDIIDKQLLVDYIEQADKILVEFGATLERFLPSDELKKLCLQYDLHMLQSQCKHLGTDANFETMKNMIDYLETQSRVDIRTNSEVIDVQSFGIDETKTIVYKDDYSNISTCEVDTVIFAVGRVGSGFFSDWCIKNNVNQKNNQVDIGVRVELPSIIWSDFEKKIYEPKILYRGKKYGDLIRMFCFNGRGEVVTENTNGVLTVNGHAYKSEDKKTENTNFALLSTIRFTQPFNKPIEYARHVASLANMITGGSVLVQRLGDLEQGRRSDESRIAKANIIPTLKGAVPGDLSLCMPKRQLENIIEALHALNNVAPGTANYDTLLYGIECKYYSARPETSDTFEIVGKPDFYAIGDGAGFTRSLAQAAAQGLMVADIIANKH
jgi:hypothetical protein